nr:hypothetical protein [Morchella crassipes]
MNPIYIIFVLRVFTFIPTISGPLDFSPPPTFPPPRPLRIPPPIQDIGKGGMQGGEWGGEGGLHPPPSRTPPHANPRRKSGLCKRGVGGDAFPEFIRLTNVIWDAGKPLFFKYSTHLPKLENNSILLLLFSSTSNTWFT